MSMKKIAAAVAATMMVAAPIAASAAEGAQSLSLGSYSNARIGAKSKASSKAAGPLTPLIIIAVLAGGFGIYKLVDKNGSK